MSDVIFEIRSAWDGGPLQDGESARVAVSIDRAEGTLRIASHARFYGDPPPPGPAGRFDGLWDFEVVEIFLLGAARRYLEVELGPHGHYLALSLDGPRTVVDAGIDLQYSSQRSGDAWRGEATLPLATLPTGLRAGNAYAIHGTGAERRYLAAHPVPGAAPDFHRLEDFAPIGGLDA